MNMDNRNGGKLALEIVPEEMWKAIFSHIYSPERGHSNWQQAGKPLNQLVGSDLLSCSRVCKDFERLLKPTETTWLFKEVFPILFKYLPKEDMLRCRQVCKEWDRSVNTFFQEMTQKCTFDEIPPIRKSYSIGRSMEMLRNVSKNYKFDQKEKVVTFLHLVSDTHGKTGRSPFLMPSIYVGEPRLLENEDRQVQIEYWNKVEDLLTKFGGYLREFTVFIPNQQALTDYDEDEEDDYRLEEFQRFISKVIRCLNLVKKTTIFLEIGGSLSFRWVTRRQQREFWDVFGTPDTPSGAGAIKALRFDQLRDPSFVIQRSLVTLYASQLAHLSMVIDENAFSWCVPSDMPNLKELFIKVKSMPMFENFVSRLRESRNPPSLIALGLRLCERRTEQGQLLRIFPVFNQFGSTLKSLVIHADREEFTFAALQELANACRRDAHVKLDCPRLQSVKLSFCSTLSLNLLTNCADSLEELWIEVTVEISPREAAYPNEIVDFYDHIENMTWQNSNIWQVFPRLQFVHVDYLHIDKAYRVEGRTYRNEKKISTTKKHVTTYYLDDAGDYYANDDESENSDDEGSIGSMSSGNEEDRDNERSEENGGTEEEDIDEENV